VGDKSTIVACSPESGGCSDSVVVMADHTAMKLVGVLAVVMAATPGCTLASMGLVGSTIGVHNELASSRDQWSYETPVLIGAAVGFIVDIACLVLLGHEWNKPTT
jgi:hypothetical protein